jgi:hypothetical protein
MLALSMSALGGKADIPDPPSNVCYLSRPGEEPQFSLIGIAQDRGNDRLGVLEVDVSRNSKAEEAASLLTMNHCDNSGAMLLFNCPDRLGPAHRIPPSHKQRLQRHERNHYEEY